MAIYQTITTSHHATIPPIRGSKFEGYVFHVETQEQVKEIIEKIRAMHPKANHVCYAYRIGLHIQQDIMGQVMAHSERDYASDDGEPSGTAGRPILQVLQGADLRQVGCAVVRYFGGTLLGVGGLVKAYTQTAQVVAQKAKIIQTPITRKVVVRVGFDAFHELMQYRQQHSYDFTQETRDDDIQVTLTLPWGDYDDFQSYCQLKGWEIEG